MHLDDLLGTLHDDRQDVVNTKLQAVERQLLLRRLESLALSAALIRQIDDLTEQIINLEPEPGRPDTRRRDRDSLERERRDRQFQLQQEAIQKWRDIQLLKQETRLDNREQHEEQQRYDRLSGANYDARQK